ncbi:MAG: DUF1838 family protein [Pyrinomonadaceae bacterium]|nr:DUF1838 family protein [Pyrinomonadaceae bacterium]MCX7639618.1 DUF1838 family protein [Pyrinomonadaceae bacterium]MDW8303364.1 DUF1838 family protein [Acidobacteriota bacterium]
MKNPFITFLVFLFFASSKAQNFTEELFKTFVEMRVGKGEPVYWYCIGEIYEFPSGKLIAKVEGIDTAKILTSESTATRAVQLSRKIFFYRNPTTNEILREYNGLKVEPIAYPYQLIIYELKDGRIISTVTQGKNPKIQRISSSAGTIVRRFDELLVFSSPLFIDSPNYKAYENYDFFIQPDNIKPKYQLSWFRRSLLPSFFGGKDSVFQLVAYRVDKYEELPASIREVLEKEARMWMQPPKDLKEIEELQK